MHINRKVNKEVVGYKKAELMKTESKMVLPRARMWGGGVREMLFKSTSLQTVDK